MKKNEKKFPCRNEELPTIGKFVRDSLIKDAADFTPYTDFNAGFVNDYDAALTTVNGLINPIGFTNEMVKVTLRLYTNMVSLRGNMDPLQNYVVNAGDTLTVLPRNFGFQAVRKAISNKDTEGLDGALKIVEQNITNNVAALKAKGYTAGMQAALLIIHKNIMDANAQQNSMTNDRDVLVDDNLDVLNSFYTNYVVKTANQGKRIYKTTKPAKVDEYTIAVLVRRIRQEQLKTSVGGTVSSSNVPANKAAVELKPIDGGRSKKARTLEDGSYVLKSVKPGAYNMFVSYGSINKVSSVKVVTGKNVVDVEL